MSTYSKLQDTLQNKMGNTHLTHPRNVKRSINQNSKLLVVVIGGPCSGKTTISHHLSTKFQLVPIAPDLLIRECVDQQSLRKPEARLERLHRQRLKTYNALLIHQKMTKEEKEFLGKGGDTIGVDPSSNHFSLFHASDSEEEDFVQSSPLVQDIQRSLKHGEPIDSTIIADLVLDAMRYSYRSNGFVIDGYPRNIDQYEAFVQSIGDPHVIVFLDCPSGAMIERALKRAQASQRCDDNEPFLNMKIESFYRNLAELTEHWVERGITILNLNGTDEVENVKNECTEQLQKNITLGQFKMRKFRDWNKIINIENVRVPQVTQVVYGGKKRGTGDTEAEDTEAGDGVVKLA